MKIFLSYAHEDYAHARKLYDALSVIPGVDVWFDKESLLPGQKWPFAITKAIRSSRLVLVLLSKHSTTKKGYYQKEIREALEVLQEFTDSDIFLVPIRLDECKPHFEQLNALQMVDLFPSWDRGFQKILGVVASDPDSLVRPKEWRLEYVEGASFALLDGIAGTRKNPSGHHSSLFPLEGTVILGDSNKGPPFNTAEHTIATWDIPLREAPLGSWGRCFLLFSCLRHFGGLHSPVANDWVEIRLNGHPVDGFEIRIVPEGQTDYFHQRPFPNIPKLPPFSSCENIYAVPQQNLWVTLGVGRSPSA